MDVTGAGSVHAGFPLRSIDTASVGPAADLPAARSSDVLAPRDEVEISSAGRLLDQLSQTGDVRAERLEDIRRSIADGTYESADKLERAVDRLLDEIGFDRKSLR